MNSINKACWSWGVTVNITSYYRLDNRGSILGRDKKDFSSILCVQTGSEAHPASCPKVTEVLSLALKRGRGVTLTAHST
jgi:hypothetical protein